MSLKFKCFICDGKYLCCSQTTRIYGPIIEITCPNCGRVQIRNMSAFLHDQVSYRKAERLPDARLMIALAQEVGRTVNDDHSWRKKKKKK